MLQRTLWNYTHAATFRSLGPLPFKVCALAALFGNTTPFVIAGTWMYRFVQTTSEAFRCDFETQAQISYKTSAEIINLAVNIVQVTVTVINLTRSY